MFRDYANDIPACMVREMLWRRGEDEDEKEERVKNEEGEEITTSPITIMLTEKPENLKNEVEKWDEHLTNTCNKVENWRAEKTGIGPEPELAPPETEDSPSASIYADDNSTSVSAKTIAELKEKTEDMLGKIFEHMGSSRLLVNA